MWRVSASFTEIMGVSIQSKKNPWSIDFRKLFTSSFENPTRKWFFDGCCVFASRVVMPISKISSANSSSFCGNVQKIVDKLCSTWTKYLIEIDCSSWQHHQQQMRYHVNACIKMKEKQPSGSAEEINCEAKNNIGRNFISTYTYDTNTIRYDAMHFLSAFFDLKNLISNKSDSKWHPVWTWRVELSFHSLTLTPHSQSCIQSYLFSLLWSSFLFVSSSLSLPLALLLSCRVVNLVTDLNPCYIPPQHQTNEWAPKSRRALWKEEWVEFYNEREQGGRRDIHSILPFNKYVHIHAHSHSHALMILPKNMFSCW